MNKNVFLSYLMARLREPSTWRGVVAVLTAIGVSFSAEQANAVISAGVGMIGLIGVFFPDATKGAAK